jgi:hypothetical protein
MPIPPPMSMWRSAMPEASSLLASARDPPHGCRERCRTEHLRTDVASEPDHFDLAQAGRLAVQARCTTIGDAELVERSPVEI